MILEHMIEIQQTQQSRLAELDFENLRFGREFSDHMVVMDYRDGAWQPATIRAY